MTIADKIMSYAQSTYKQPQLELSLAEVQQLAWVQDNPLATSELNNLQPVASSFHIEIIRCLTRLYCLQLLRDGNYAAFTNAQSNDKNKLTPEHFANLASSIQALDEATYAALRVVTILSSVSLSPTAKQIAEENMANYADLPSNDAVAWLSQTFYAAPEIYPIVTDYLDKYGMEKLTLLRAAFMPNTHFRHMLYTEGGQGMFSYLRDAIKTNEIGATQLNFWYLYWMINITGFRGHIDNMGSKYLNENTYTAICHLYGELLQLLNNPEHDVFANYLNHRAELLGLNPGQSMGHSLDEAKLLSSIACMLRLFDKDSAYELSYSLDLMPELPFVKKQFEITCNSNEPTPTYAPALFANAKSKGLPIRKVVSLLLPFFSECLAKYREKGDFKNALSFRNISNKENLTNLLALLHNGHDYNINISAGLVSVDKVAPKMLPSYNKPKKASEVAKLRNFGVKAR